MLFLLCFFLLNLPQLFLFQSQAKFVILNYSYTVLKRQPSFSSQKDSSQTRMTTVVARNKFSEFFRNGTFIYDYLYFEKCFDVVNTKMFCYYSEESSCFTTTEHMRSKNQVSKVENKCQFIIFICIWIFFNFFFFW